MEKNNQVNQIQSENRRLSFTDVWIYFKKHLVVIISILILSLVGGITYDVVSTPEYKSTATMLVQYEGNDNNHNLNSDYTFSRYISNTYVEFIKKDIVLKTVAEDLNVSVSKIRSNLDVRNSGDSLILDVTYTDEDPLFAKEVVTKIIDQTLFVTNQEVDGKPVYKMLFDNLKLLSAADVGVKVSKTVTHLVVSFLIGLVISAIYVVIRVITDNRFRSNEEIEKTLNLPVLAGIPNYEFDDDKKGDN